MRRWVLELVQSLGWKGVDVGVHDTLYVGETQAFFGPGGVTGLIHVGADGGEIFGAQG